MYKSIVFLSILFISFSSIAQSDVEYSFEGTRNGEKIDFKVVIHSGSTCQGITLERGLDSFNFAPIAIQYGVCGNANFDQLYRFSDTMPPSNQPIFYRLQLGDFATPFIQFVFLKLAKDRPTLFPNPSTSTMNVYFPNSDVQYFDLNVIDNKGVLQFQELNIRSESTMLNTSKLSAGSYILQLRNQKTNNIIHEKFIVE